MNVIVPFGLMPDSPNPLLSPDQQALLYRVYIPVEQMIIFTLQLWQVLFGDLRNYQMECVDSELHLAFVSHFESCEQLSDFNERMSVTELIERRFGDFTAMVFCIYNQLKPYVGTIPCCPTEDVLERFGITPLGRTAMVIEMRYESEDDVVTHEGGAL